MEKSLRVGRLPSATFLTSVVPSEAFIDAEQTKPPGIASTSTPRFGESRSSSGSCAGTTGRSLTTESSPLRWTLRARTTTPFLFSARSGVSKK